MHPPSVSTYLSKNLIKVPKHAKVIRVKST